MKEFNSINDARNHISELARVDKHGIGEIRGVKIYLSDENHGNDDRYFEISLTPKEVTPDIRKELKLLTFEFFAMMRFQFVNVEKKRNNRGIKIFYSTKEREIGIGADDRTKRLASSRPLILI